MRRLLALVTVAAVAVLAAPADAKPYTYSDPKDMPANAGLDIVGVTYATEGTTTVRKVRGRSVKTYEPKKLVVAMTMAAAPLDDPGIKYTVVNQAEGCGEMAFSYSAGAASSALSLSQLRVGCGGAPGTTGGDTLFVDPQFAVKGNKLVWTVPLKALPKNVRKGALLYGFKASVDVTDPAIGIYGPEDFGDGILDKAKSDGDWVIA